MAIEWGAYEDSGGNGIRVGISVDWEDVSHGESAVTATVRYYTENRFSYGDGQTLRLGGAIDGTVNFTNNDGGSPVLRATRSYTYTYDANEYGSSPGKRTFSVSLSGAYNGVTPSKTVEKSIPARPIAAPFAPDNATVTRISDTAAKVSWRRDNSWARPYETQILHRSINGGAFVSINSSMSGDATSINVATALDTKYQFRVYARNDAGTSGYSETGFLLTTPNDPTNASRSGANGANQVITWTNTASYEGNSDYVTEVWRADNGVWALLTTVAGGVATYTDTYPATHPGTKFKYRARHKTNAGVQGALTSDYSNETTETTGTTSPPNTPTNLSPNGALIDPTRTSAFSWAFNPTTVGDTQVQFQVRYRLAGASTWTTPAAVTSSTPSWTAPANTFQDDSVYEWQVRTRGADPTWSPWATAVTFNTAVTPIAPDPIKLPAQIDLFTGRVEASPSVNEIRDYAMRAQSQLMGGGVKAVDASFNISWTQRMITIGLGRSQISFPGGQHDILNPKGWGILAGSAISGGKATFVLDLTSSTMAMRAGETITVTGSSIAALNGEYVVRSTSTNSITVDTPLANQSIPAAGTVYPTIHVHGGSPAPANVIPTAGKIPLNAWDALYYEMPFGWGSGSTARKNGVVRVTSAQVTSNEATLTVTAPHYFVIGEQIDIEGVGAPYDGIGKAVTKVTETSVSYALTNANTGPTAVNGLAKPQGKATFMGNYHIVRFSAGDFTVPSNWILLAVRNNDLGSVEWGTGDVVDPGYDSDSPVLKQVILTSATDANTTAGNKPPLRVGPPTGAHLRIDGNEILAMTGNTGQGELFLNGGGKATCNDFQANGNIWQPNIPTTSGAANLSVNTSTGGFRLSTSSRRFKENIKPYEVDVETALRLRPMAFQRNDDLDDEGNRLPVTEDSPWYVGFIAEEAEELGLEPWVTRDKDGAVFGFGYDQWVIALQAIVQSQQRRIEALEQKIDAKDEALNTLTDRVIAIESRLGGPRRDG